MYEPCGLEIWTPLRAAGVVLFAVLELRRNEGKRVIVFANVVRWKVTFVIWVVKP